MPASSACRQTQANQTAHAGAQPIQAGNRRLLLQVLQQLEHGLDIDRGLVPAGLGEPVAAAPARHVGTNDAQRRQLPLNRVAQQGLGQHVKITSLARQAMHTDKHMPSIR